ncbi:MAG: hypothetical protein RXR31_07525 [Thermoproteota archaeon]|jgi:hypothetical protein
MTKERKRKSLFDELFEDFFSDEFSNLSSFGGGYSISITQSGGKTVIHVKADRNTDVQKLRKELEEQYPGAEIYIEGGKITLEEIGSESKEKVNTEEKPKKKSLIEVIDEKKLEEE